MPANESILRDYRERVVRAQLEKMDDSPNDELRIQVEEESNLPEHAELIDAKKIGIESKRAQIEELRRDVQQMKDEVDVVRNIPVLFDSADARIIRFELNELIRAGVKKVQVAERTYTVEELTAILGAVEDFVQKYRTAAGTSSQPDAGTFLDDVGVTHGKISPHSKYAFHEALQNYLDSDFTRVP